ncbi:hypothetical protein L0B53_01220 [Vibrio sp. SS-MA-C1-2]|uniref:hypothetical protein n=1 Tax=Vibrio sp. SS-MA-C1-2 TaxID=2908646 RepID=UPI001F1596FF|nr:hypothetical protein [Vibrio sp. SS-MA-C1-2]UJF17424.1 hypothetical protein L0B53_01220 [Vibrio sp. SS-MA-C1-2]
MLDSNSELQLSLIDTIVTPGNYTLTIASPVEDNDVQDLVFTFSVASEQLTAPELKEDLTQVNQKVANWQLEVGLDNHSLSSPIAFNEIFTEPDELYETFTYTINQDSLIDSGLAVFVNGDSFYLEGTPLTSTNAKGENYTISINALSSNQLATDYQITLPNVEPNPAWEELSFDYESRDENVDSPEIMQYLVEKNRHLMGSPLTEAQLKGLKFGNMDHDLEGENYTFYTDTGWQFHSDNTLTVFEYDGDTVECEMTFNWTYNNPLIDVSLVEQQGEYCGFNEDGFKAQFAIFDAGFGHYKMINFSIDPSEFEDVIGDIPKSYGKYWQDSFLTSSFDPEVIEYSGDISYFSTGWDPESDLSSDDHSYGLYTLLIDLNQENFHSPRVMDPTGLEITDNEGWIVEFGDKTGTYYDEGGKWDINWQVNYLGIITITSPEHAAFVEHWIINQREDNSYFVTTMYDQEEYINNGVKTNSPEGFGEIFSAVFYPLDK